MSAGIMSREFWRAAVGCVGWEGTCLTKDHPRRLQTGRVQASGPGARARLQPRSGNQALPSNSLELVPLDGIVHVLRGAVVLKARWRHACCQCNRIRSPSWPTCPKPSSGVSTTHGNGSEGRNSCAKARDDGPKESPPWMCPRQRPPAGRSTRTGRRTRTPPGCW